MGRPVSATHNSTDKQLDPTRGVRVTGEIAPYLEAFGSTVGFTRFCGSTSGYYALDVTARITVEGPAASPTFAISSTPHLPQDEVISRVLFQRAAGGLSSGQALQLAPAAVLPGGLALHLQPGALSVRARASPEESGVSVDVDITRRFKAKTEVGADGSTSVGAGYELEW